MFVKIEIYTKYYISLKVILTVQVKRMIDLVYISKWQPISKWGIVLWNSSIYRWSQLFSEKTFNKILSTLWCVDVNDVIIEIHTSKKDHIEDFEFVYNVRYGWSEIDVD